MFQNIGDFNHAATLEHLTSLLPEIQDIETDDICYWYAASLIIHIPLS